MARAYATRRNCSSVASGLNAKSFASFATRPPLPYTLRDIAADAVGLLDALSIQRAHLVGGSMLGNVAQFIAIDHPDRVQSLTTIGSDSANPTLPLIANPAAFARVPQAPAVDDKDAVIDFQFATYQALPSPGYPTPDPVMRQEVEHTVDRVYDPDGLMRQHTVALVDHLLRDGYRHANSGRSALLRGLFRERMIRCSRWRRRRISRVAFRIRSCL